MTSSRSSILALSVLLTSSLLLTGCGEPGPIPAVPPSGASSSSTSLPSSMPTGAFTLEAMTDLYGRARASVDAATPDTYFTLVEEITNDPAKVAEFRARWSDPEAKRALKTFALPDLATGTFLEFKQEGDWAGYYYLSELDDIARLTIDVIRFHQKDGTWRVYPRGGSSSVEAPASKVERVTTIKELMTDSDALRLIPKGY